MSVRRRNRKGQQGAFRGEQYDLGRIREPTHLHLRGVRVVVSWEKRFCIVAASSDPRYCRSARSSALGVDPVTGDLMRGAATTIVEQAAALGRLALLQEAVAQSLAEDIPDIDDAAATAGLVERLGLIAALPEVYRAREEAEARFGAATPWQHGRFKANADQLRLLASMVEAGSCNNVRSAEAMRTAAATIMELAAMLRSIDDTMRANLPDDGEPSTLDLLASLINRSKVACLAANERDELYAWRDGADAEKQRSAERDAVFHETLATAIGRGSLEASRLGDIVEHLWTAIEGVTGRTGLERDLINAATLKVELERCWADHNRVTELDVAFRTVRTALRLPSDATYEETIARAERLAEHEAKTSRSAIVSDRESTIAMMAERRLLPYEPDDIKKVARVNALCPPGWHVAMARSGIAVFHPQEVVPRVTLTGDSTARIVAEIWRWHMQPTVERLAEFQEGLADILGWSVPQLYDPSGARDMLTAVASLIMAAKEAE